MEVITSWNGTRACALQRSLRMSNLAFAVHVGVSVRSVAGWHQKPGRVLAQGTAELLEAALGTASERAKAQFAALTSEASGEAAHCARDLGQAQSSAKVQPRTQSSERSR
jgi:hypothetical protein